MRMLFIVLPTVKGSYIYTSMPLGIAYLAACIRDRHQVRVWDTNVEFGGVRGILKVIGEYRPDIVGFSVVTPAYPSGDRLARVIKQNFPDIKIVMGGHHVTALPGLVLESPAVDYVIAGEGERTLPRLLETLEQGGGPGSVEGVGCKQDDEIMINPPPPMVEDLDSLPFPAWDMMPMARYRGRLRPSVDAICTRGCPFQCMYCASHLTHGRKVRRRSVANVIEELRILKNKYGIRYIHFFDETFTLSREYAIELCESIMENGLEMDYWCYTRVDRVDPELLAIMRRAGFVAVAYGFESGVRRLLDIVGKNTTLEQAREAVKITREAGIIPEGYFIINIPTETWEESLETVRFAKELDLFFFNLIFATPYPGTRMLDIIREKNLTMDRDPDYDKYWFTADLVIENPGNPHDRLYRLQRLTNLGMAANPRTVHHALKFLLSGAKPGWYDFFHALRFLAGKVLVNYKI